MTVSADEKAVKASEHTASMSSFNESENASENESVSGFEASTIGQMVASLFHFGRNSAIDVPRKSLTRDSAERVHDENAGEGEEARSRKSVSRSPSLCPDETRALSRLHKRLSAKYKKDESSVTDSSFLLTLATCAAEEASASKDPVASTQDDTEDFHTQEETMYQMLDRTKHQAELQKQTAKQTKTFLHHLQHVNQHVLPTEFEQILQAALMAQDHAATVPEQSFLETMSIWLGQRGDNALLDLVLDAVSADDSLANATELLDWFYRLAVAAYTLERCLEEVQENVNGNIATVEFGPLQKPNALSRSLLETAREIRGESGLFQNVSDNILSKGNSKEPQAGMVNRDEVKYWHQTNFPAIASSLSLFMRQLVFVDLQSAPKQSGDPHFVQKRTSTLSDASWDSVSNGQGPGVVKTKKIHLFPVLDQGSNQDGDILSSPISPLTYALTCMSNENFGHKWHRLYTTSCDGLSINRLEHSIKGYDGPTLFLLRAFVDDESRKTATFGAYASSQWKKNGSMEFFGEPSCFLFQLYPHVKVMRTSNNSRGGRYQYFKVSGSARSNPKTAVGIGFGGSAAQPRLFIPTSLDKCYASPTDTSFEPGELVPRDSGVGPWWFELDCLEIWGVGDDDAMGARSIYRNTMDSHLQKARQVDKAAFLNDFRTGLIESKMFDFRQQMIDRDGGCLLDCDPDADDSGWQIGPR